MIDFLLGTKSARIRMKAVLSIENADGEFKRAYLHTFDRKLTASEIVAVLAGYEASKKAVDKTESMHVHLTEAACPRKNWRGPTSQALINYLRDYPDEIVPVSDVRDYLIERGYGRTSIRDAAKTLRRLNCLKSIPPSLTRSSWGWQLTEKGQFDD